MHSTLLCFNLLLLFVLPYSSLCQGQRYTAITNVKGEQNKMVIDVLSRFGFMGTQLSTNHRLEPRGVRITRPGSSTPKRAMQGSRIALSLDVPTTILSVLIDMARERDMRAKAAANAELMARIGKRK
ncbi:urocortin-3-like [Trichomycterus rosablanca]|uniref:urocortin-3-like n=1 Tax=Trichomycterus rosablanca TaxID=2290929 RepID=UPI002F34F77C